MGAALSEDADRQAGRTSFSEAVILAEASGGTFWKGVKSTQEHVLAFLHASSHLALRESDQPSWFPQDTGSCWDASLSVFKQKQSQVKLDELVSETAG